MRARAPGYASRKSNAPSAMRSVLEPFPQGCVELPARVSAWTHEAKHARVVSATHSGRDASGVLETLEEAHAIRFVRCTANRGHVRLFAVKVCGSSPHRGIFASS